MKIHNRLLVTHGKKIKLSKLDPDDTQGLKNDERSQRMLQKLVARLDNLQYLLYASKKYSLLIVLQGIDAAGKDGTIRHVMSGVNPQSCRVTSFKTPSAEEAAHDFLWRIHNAIPDRGEIGIFNRSHYEDVLVVRVHKLVPESIWSRRYKQINQFERILSENNVKILKFYLHISKEEQKIRFQQRLDDRTKWWKLSPADFQERKYWNDYMDAYEDVLRYCSTPWAPWYIIPANKHWFRNLAVSHIIVKTLEDLNMKFPKPSFNVSRYVLK
ncbi:MAG: polyphosphate kinase 2 family protein [Candidatus Bathyarchaeia archaeon]|jgi:PPK2 family polyphosphate:nucleotide phosphotransferase